MADPRETAPAARPLNDVAKPEPNADRADPGSSAIVKNYDPTEDQEKVRSNIAYWLIAALLSVIFVYCLVGLVGGLACWSANDCTRLGDSFAILREFLGVALASITGLVGAVTGFYFEAQTAKKGLPETGALRPLSEGAAALA